MKRRSRQSDAGFTLMEMIIVVAIVGILAAIAAPNFLAMLTKQRLNDAQSEAISAIREAQTKARQQKRRWEVCIQDDNTQVRWFVRPVTNGSNCATNPGPWNDLIGSDAKIIQIDPASSLDGGYYKVQFEPNGWVITTQTNPDQDVNKLIFKIRNQTGSKRCVYIATLLGSIRTQKDNECQ